jgi:MoxR-like ATPase
MTAVHTKFANLQLALCHSLEERDAEVAMLLRAVLAAEHCILFGPPGTAKSLAARILCLGIEGADYFEILMSRFTSTSEIFGPPSVKGLQEDEYRRVTAGFLPSAHVAFIDEVFKSNSSILNTMLQIVNERTFTNGRTRETCPLIVCVAASNEFPDDSALEAFYDRFLTRRIVKPIEDDASFGRMLTSSAPPLPRVTLEELATAQREVGEVRVEAAVSHLTKLRRQLKLSTSLKSVNSDRRWKKCLRLLQAAAWLEGRDEVVPRDLHVLVDALWTTQEEIAIAASQVGSYVAALEAEENRKREQERLRQEQDRVRQEREAALVREKDEARRLAGAQMSSLQRNVYSQEMLAQAPIEDDFFTAHLMKRTNLALASAPRDEMLNRIVSKIMSITNSFRAGAEREAVVTAWCTLGELYGIRTQEIHAERGRREQPPPPPADNRAWPRNGGNGGRPGNATGGVPSVLFPSGSAGGTPGPRRPASPGNGKPGGGGRPF